MSDEIYDPYDVNNYIQPIKNLNNETNDKKKNIFVDENFNTTTNESFDREKIGENEKDKTKVIRKRKRKKTDENLPQNIDLTKSAYDEDKKKDNKSFTYYYTRSKRIYKY